MKPKSPNPELTKLKAELLTLTRKLIKLRIEASQIPDKRYALLCSVIEDLTRILTMPL